MRLIDADILKDLIQQCFDMQDLYLPAHMIHLIDETPTVDAVPVVRCKDCKHRPQKYPSGFEDGDGCCPCICDDYFYSWYPDDNWFCANGEREGETKCD